MSSVWRFYKDQDRHWRWQRLSIDRAVIAESRAAHKNYDDCVADATGKGYVHQPSQPRLIRKTFR
ncbi:MAG: hypothetical protein HY526_01130 [Betaproteobacteria bacterium]|nr:hypothetical protein [Betaproteobacteria bacterium]